MSTRILLSIPFVYVVILAITPKYADGQDQPLKIGLIGDSTVATTYGWGPAIESRFNDRVEVLHFAKNGATLPSLSKKLDELLTHDPDFVLIQFGHNDQKRYPPNTYREHLMSYVQRVTQSGSRAIVLSSVTRRVFNQDGKIATRKTGVEGTLAEFAGVAKQVAHEQGVGFIDLHTISVKHHNTIGPIASSAYDFNEADKTHFSPEGARAIAELILNELPLVAPEINPYVR